MLRPIGLMMGWLKGSTITCAGYTCGPSQGFARIDLVCLKVRKMIVNIPSEDNFLKILKKKLRHTTTKEKSAYMLAMQIKNRGACKYNENENWMRDILIAQTQYKWTRQARWGYRLFDFWCHELGCAVEVDGPEHNKGYDQFRDYYNYVRSGIIVIRVKNKNEEDAAEAIAYIKTLGSWEERRIANRCGKRKQVVQERFGNNLTLF